MERELAESKDNHERFVASAVKNEEVWVLQGPDGPAVSGSIGDEDIAVVQFWAEAVHAEQAAVEEWGEFEPEAVSLYDFLFRWLPGMHEDEALVGTNLSDEKIGLELEPALLEEELRDAMGERMIDSYEAKLEQELTKSKTKKKKQEPS